MWFYINFCEVSPAYLVWSYSNSPWCFVNLPSNYSFIWLVSSLVLFLVSSLNLKCNKITLRIHSLHRCFSSFLPLWWSLSCPLTPSPFSCSSTTYSLFPNNNLNLPYRTPPAEYWRPFRTPRLFPSVSNLKASTTGPHGSCGSLEPFETAPPL